MAPPTHSRSAIATTLTALLPSDLAISLYHIATSPCKTKPLFTPAPNKKPSPTTLESHFIAISHDDVLAFAIELLVYTLVQTGERIIFVSKADSSGYLPPSAASYSTSSSSEARISLVRSVAETAVRIVLDGAKAANPEAKITVSLFARSQSAYLFPNSFENKNKHVLEDRGLIAWWCRVLDPVFRQHSAAAAAAMTGGAKAYLLVPGFDRLQTKKLFPAHVDGDTAEWIVGHPLKIDPERDLLVREIIPHFPDDPKARFLDELNGDGTGKKNAKCTQRPKQWAGITTVEHFWDLMSMRSECAGGRCVGFIWVVIEGDGSVRKTSSPTEPEIPLSPLELGRETSPVSSSSPVTPSPPSVQQIDSDSSNSPPQPTASPPPSGPLSPPPLIIPPLSSSTSTSPKSPKKRSHSTLLMSPRKKKLRTLDTEILQRKQPLVSSAVVLDEKRYQRTIDALLNHTDFKTLEHAKAGTRKWVQSSYAVVKSSNVIIRDGWDWGEVVTGSLQRVQRERPMESVRAGVNVLAVRKRETAAPAVNTLLPRKRENKTAPVVNTLQPRKKEAAVVNTLVPRKKEAAPVVNVLAAGLVRKKEKPQENGEEPKANVLAGDLVKKEVEEEKPVVEKKKPVVEKETPVEAEK
ncbi:histone acetylation protein-domain-containing protein [Tricharina praecox]|uniref:histone acetylation protein-domain-containing protein n=1 Tax=Tricharina praecox TaxID=43433 RepID=UPI00221FCC48|nr:histone acetylation protein-domain-containing protein [Tricharina praecox]KAI5844186.1 histone acetylation protein-domain-containing protein [Tricharina praecox]